MNKKGQALVEFVLILPIILLLLFTIYDFGMIFTKKNKLESDSSDIIYLYRNNHELKEIQDIYKDYKIDITSEDEYYKINIKYNINILTPGLNKVLGDPYKIEVKRYIENAK